MSSTPAVPSSLYLLGDVSAIAGPIPMGVSMKWVDSVLGLTGVDLSSISAAKPRALLERMDRPLPLLLDLSICSRARSRADCLLGRAPIKTGISSIDRERSIVVKSLYVKPENAKDINETLPIGASIDKEPGVN